MPINNTCTEQPSSKEAPIPSSGIGWQVAETLTVSILLLLVVSTLKYHLEHRNEDRDYWAFGLELPIDVGTVLMSFFITFHYLVDNINWFFALILLQIGTMVISMILRNRALDDYVQVDSSLQAKILKWYVIVESVLVLFPSIILLIFKLI